MYGLSPEMMLVAARERQETLAREAAASRHMLRFLTRWMSTLRRSPERAVRVTRLLRAPRG
jgi:hypothetical protein